MSAMIAREANETAAMRGIQGTLLRLPPSQIFAAIIRPGSARRSVGSSRSLTG